MGLHAVSEPPDAALIELEPVEGSLTDFRLRITPSETLRAGRFSFSVRISAQHTDLRPGPSREVTAVGTIRGDIEAQPSVVMFGARPVDEVAADRIVVRSRSRRPLHVRLLQSDPTLQVKRIGGTDAAALVFELQQRFSQQGERWGSVQFAVQYRDEDDPLETVVVETYYYGVAAQLGTSAEESGP